VDVGKKAFDCLGRVGRDPYTRLGSRGVSDLDEYFSLSSPEATPGSMPGVACQDCRFSRLLPMPATGAILRRNMDRPSKKKYLSHDIFP
jgi:hypothetical protein